MGNVLSIIRQILYTLVPSVRGANKAEAEGGTHDHSRNYRRGTSQHISSFNHPPPSVARMFVPEVCPISDVVASHSRRVRSNYDLPMPYIIFSGLLRLTIHPSMTECGFVDQMLLGNYRAMSSCGT